MFLEITYFEKFNKKIHVYQNENYMKLFFNLRSNEHLFILVPIYIIFNKSTLTIMILAKDIAVAHVDRSKQIFVS